MSADAKCLDLSKAAAQSVSESGKTGARIAPLDADQNRGLHSSEVGLAPRPRRGALLFTCPIPKTEDKGAKAMLLRIPNFMKPQEVAALRQRPISSPRGRVVFSGRVERVACWRRRRTLPRCRARPTAR